MSRGFSFISLEQRGAGRVRGVLFGIVSFGVAAQVAIGSACDLIVISGCMAVPAIQESHCGGIKIKQVQLLTAV